MIEKVFNMAKLAQTSVKYLIKAKFDAAGVVEKPDVIGALFGQTEGLLGPELDLRELQRTGRIGRVEVKSISQRGKTNGEITIPSSLDNTETALIAASMETIDRVGPCDAKIQILSIEDLRTIKRGYIIDRAKELLSALLYQIPDTSVVTEELMQNIRAAEVVEYKGLPSGPDVATSDSIVVCEGRADVVNLLRHGVKNAVAIGGTSVPPIFAEIAKEKEITAFLDGDRGGDLILKELKQIGEVDFVARAPEGKEVEELTKKEVFKALRDKVPVEQAAEIKPMVQKSHEDYNNGGSSSRENVPYQQPEEQETETEYAAKAPAAATNVTTIVKRPTSAPVARKKMDENIAKLFKEHLNDLIGTRAAAIFDNNMSFVGKVPLKELQMSVRQVENPSAIVLDGYIDKILMKFAESVGVQFLVGTSIKDKIFSSKVTVLTDKEL